MRKEVEKVLEIVNSEFGGKAPTRGNKDIATGEYTFLWYKVTEYSEEECKEWDKFFSILNDLLHSEETRTAVIALLMAGRLTEYGSNPFGDAWRSIKLDIRRASDLFEEAEEFVKKGGQILHMPVTLAKWNSNPDEFLWDYTTGECKEICLS